MHCLHIEPIETYNKIPMRDMMSEIYGFPMELCKRGVDWNIGPKEKLGGAPTPSYFTNEYYQKLLYDTSGSNFVLPIEKWVFKEHEKWRDAGNRRAKHLGYLIWQMRNELDE